MMETVEYRGEVFDTRHGGPFDRGSADSYYGREAVPHYYEGKTSFTPRVESQDMTLAEVRAYFAGYDYNEEFGHKKDYGV